MVGEPPINEELTRQIVDELARRQDHSAIIQSVCEQAGLNWQQAERSVKQVESEQSHTIAGRQSPLIILLSTVIVAAGLGILYFSFPGLPGNYHGNMLFIMLVANYPFMLGILGLVMIADGMIRTYRHLLHYLST